MKIAIEVEETKVQANGKRLGTWRMEWGTTSWTGTWKTDDEALMELGGDRVQETPISREALEELIYCTQEV
jgi:hypothetical protein